MHNPDETIENAMEQARPSVIASAICFAASVVLLFANIYRRNGSPAWTCTMVAFQSITAFSLGHLLGSGQWRK